MEPAVDLLRREYIQLLEPDKVTIPAPNLIRVPHVQRQIFQSIFQEGSLAFPPPDRYKLRVLKKLIESMERAIKDPEEDEISDDLVSCLAKLMSRSQVSEFIAAQQKHYVTYTAPLPMLDSPSVTLLEARSLIASSGTTGIRTWDAALNLGHFLFSAEGRSYAAGQKILELGAGIGFLAINCAKYLGADLVLATDGSGEALDELESNIYLNGLGNSGKIHTGVLRWGHTLNSGVLDPHDTCQSYDTIIGADVLFIDVTFLQLIYYMFFEAQRLRFKADVRSFFYPSLVIIAATVRNDKTHDAFITACSQNHFIILTLSNPTPDRLSQLGFFHSNSVPIRLLKITNPK
ncbi:hypothetical protein MMC14_004704 [Varicellaria rhodocarpa]|nr:hypothetical protein [Varicellaria rhodocarpa]